MLADKFGKKCSSRDRSSIATADILQVCKITFEQRFVFVIKRQSPGRIIGRIAGF